MVTTKLNAEQVRLRENGEGRGHWHRWGPYLSERQWGTVREDYSAGGDAWDEFSHEQARSRAYRWGEDGIGGLSDDHQRLCLGVALWNGRDPILKERLFGLTNGQGNHGEDVKELYYYLDATPSHSYLRMLYKYPQAAFPYQWLVEESGRRGLGEPEFELIDTGLFDESRYFDVEIEYAKADDADTLMRVTAHNRGPDAARLHILPQLWFRNRWSWKEGSTKPTMAARGDAAVATSHRTLGPYAAHFDAPEALLFCENETNFARLYGISGRGDHPKDAFHDYLIEGRRDAVNPAGTGTKVCGVYRPEIPAGGRHSIRLRLAKGDVMAEPFADFDAIFARRRQEADAYFGDLQRGVADEDERRVQRQALAGMIWSKQYYHYDVPEWLHGDPTQPPPPPERRHGRNSDWDHVNTDDIISMPDKWEYPWFAAWDLAFHCVPLALVDAEFAKAQLILMGREWYQHPSGQLPAYEWDFGDVNPPVHAWATWRVFQIDRKSCGTGDVKFLERVFHKLLLNFTWWVNRKDKDENNIFQGGFLGLDNIGVFDRSKALPGGSHIDQADGTAWMAMFSLNMMRIALELARHNDVYEDIATKFFEHFLHIAEAMNNFGGREHGLWDDGDKFYYDVLHFEDGTSAPMKVRSIVGLIPLFAVEVLEPELLQSLPNFNRRLEWFLRYRPDLASLVSRWHEPGAGDRHLLSLLRGHRMKRLLSRMLDPAEFLSDYGIRALSKVHEGHPYTFSAGGETQAVRYVPGESDSYLFGGNSNWRGPIWMPINFLLIESMQRFHHYYGDDFRIECPTGSGNFVSILEASQEVANRLKRIFVRDGDARRAVFGDSGRFQTDPEFRDHLLFYEYFHGDTGRGVGAAHQTGWTGLIAKLIHKRGGQPARPPAHRQTQQEPNP